jgi:hypothetical protein
MAAPQTDDERDRAWWAAWRKRDFSWDGLTTHEWVGWVVTADRRVVLEATGHDYGDPRPTVVRPVAGGAATLQDYWRADPSTGLLRSDAEMGDELVAVAGQPAYHRAHLPLAYEDGTPTGKGAWAADSLDALVNARLRAAFETQGQPDARAQFLGGIWLCAPAHRDDSGSLPALRYDSARFADNADFREVAFSGNAYFREAAFSGNAYFSEAAFSGDAYFSEAAFSGNAYFSEAAFSGDAYFSEAAFSGYADFSEAAFSGDAYFSEAAFSGYADFSEAAFSGYADFSEAAFSGYADFREAAFSGYADFREVAFSGNAYFSEAAFSGYAYFSEAAFSGDAYFSEAAFSGNAYFSEAAFSGNAYFSEAAFSGNAYFREAAFSGNADFREAAFSGYADFSGRGPLLINPRVTQPVALLPSTGGAPGWTGSITTSAEMTDLARRCFGELHMSGAAFAGDVDFSDREFLKMTRFQEARFHGLALFHGCRLHQDTSFLNARFGDRSKGDAVAKRAGWLSALLRNARRLLRIIDPRTSLPRIQPAALARLYEADKRLFDARQALKASAKGSDSPKPVDERRAALNAVLLFAEWEAEYRAKWARMAQDSFKRPDVDTRFKAMESAFRTLKLAMETNRDRAEEGRFFRLELLAKRQRRDDQVPLWERVTSRLYGALADYGDSITRPLGWLFSLLVVMGAVYWGIGARLNSHADIFVPDPPSAQDCLRPVKGDEYCKKYNIVRAQIGTIQTREVGDGRVWSEHDMWSAMTFSWNNVFRPFSALSAEAVGPYEPSWASAVLYGYGPGYGLAVRMLASVQSLVSILLVFLFALAMRRRFQIS